MAKRQIYRPMPGDLQRRFIHENRDKLDEIRRRSLSGRYADQDLNEVTKIARDISRYLGIPMSNLAEISGIGAGGYRNILRGASRPKFYNFHKIISGLMTYLDQIEYRLLGHSSAGSQDLMVFHQDWTARWIDIDRDKLHEEIGNLKQCLRNIIELIETKRNAPSYVDELSQAEKEEIVLYLRTGIHILDAPKVEVGLFRKITSWLSGTTKKAAEKGLTDALHSWALRGIEIISMIFRV